MNALLPGGVPWFLRNWKAHSTPGTMKSNLKNLWCVMKGVKGLHCPIYYQAKSIHSNHREWGIQNGSPTAPPLPLLSLLNPSAPPYLWVTYFPIKTTYWTKLLLSNNRILIPFPPFCVIKKERVCVPLKASRPGQLPGSLHLMVWVWVMKPMCWQDRTNSHELSSDLHRHAMTCPNCAAKQRSKYIFLKSHNENHYSVCQLSWFLLLLLL